MDVAGDTVVVNDAYVEEGLNVGGDASVRDDAGARRRG